MKWTWGLLTLFLIMGKEGSAEPTSFIISCVVSGLFKLGEFVKQIVSYDSSSYGIEERLRRMTIKIDELSSQINNVEEELRSSIEFNAWATTCKEWENEIRNGENRLNEMLELLERSDSEHQKLQYMNDYVVYHQSHDIRGKAQNFYTLSGLPGSSTHENIFELFIAEKGCDLSEVSHLMFMIRDLMISAAKQELIYKFIKYPNDKNIVTETFMRYYDLLYGIRRYYQLNAWSCTETFLSSARREVQKIFERVNEEVSPSVLTKSMQHRLQSLFPWYEWAVALYDEDPELNLRIDSETLRPPRSYMQYTTVETLDTDDNRKVLIAWQSAEDVIDGCDSIGDARTLVVFKACSRCDSESISASRYMLTPQNCSANLYDIVQDRYQTLYGHPIPKNDTVSYPFIAATFNHPSNPCLSNASDTCNGHGKCKYIRDTSEHMCICDPFYEGIFCEEYYNPADAEKITAMLSSLRQNFAEFTGVPTVIDAYFKIKQMSEQIKYSERFTQILSQYGNVFNSIEYISDTYGKLLEGKISENTFTENIQNQHFDFIFNTFQRAILGEGLFVPHDLFTSYKKSLITDSGSRASCTQYYGLAVSAFMEKLTMHDQAVTEAYLWTKHKMLENLTDSAHYEILQDAERVLKASKARQAKYSELWNKTSCPKLMTTDLQENYCGDIHSYEGMAVDLHCRNGKEPTVSSVTCIRVNDTSDDVSLQWNGDPECRYEWGTWEPWTSCTKTCGDGQRWRTRRKPNNEVQTEVEECHLDICCEESSGKWRCPNNGKCIELSQVCDGDDDCGDKSDEDRSRCDYIRVGDSITMSYAHNPLYCYWKCYLGYNADGYVKSFDYVAAKGRRYGDAIRNYDEVAVRLKWPETGDNGWWLACLSSVCEINSCPGKYFEGQEYYTCSDNVHQIMIGKRYLVESDRKPGLLYSGDTLKIYVKSIRSYGIRSYLTVTVHRD